ncbi:MAG: hypothetical protein LBT10_03890 [Methanobrevibacter sp.]|jgi:hypothetical protein|nr:hypothetical protein [Methanobrevibacter sp.]
MSIKEINGFNEGHIDEKLKTLGKNVDMMRDINDFVHKPIIQDIFGEFDDKFDSNMGRPAISRTLILGLILYAFSKNISIASEKYGLLSKKRHGKQVYTTFK